MRAIVVSQAGGPEVLQLRERPVPRPGSGEILVDVRVAGVNFFDPLAEAAKAHADIESRTTTGKLLLLP